MKTLIILLILLAGCGKVLEPQVENLVGTWQYHDRDETTVIHIAIQDDTLKIDDNNYIGKFNNQLTEFKGIYTTYPRWSLFINSETQRGYYIFENDTIKFNIKRIK